MNVKQSRLFTFCFGLVLLLLALAYYKFERGLDGCFLAKDAMARELGQEPLSTFADFALAGQSQRAGLVLNLIENKRSDFLGKSAAEIVSILGPSDGLFEKSESPNYLIPVPTEKGSNWTLVFALTKKNQVRDAFVWRKSCK